MNYEGHYLILKRADYTRELCLTATESVMALIQCGFWPLYKQTPCKNIVKSGEKVLIYLPGDEPDTQHVMGSFTIAKVTPWTTFHKRKYPLQLDAEPSVVLEMTDVEVFDLPVPIKPLLDKLDLTPTNRQKWGCVMVGGMRRITPNDYSLLSSM
ncbi:hypothetical protein [Vibrio chaetopteri]|uniref:EVE domain-containing protein n=1 Tax=Vibrio chaetopteri TaxID=3016528 RepID=A0AAU8BT53_9VIBR